MSLSSGDHATARSAKSGPVPDRLLTTIEAFMRRTRMPPSRFGRLAAHDPRLVFDLQRGRVPGPALRQRIVAKIAAMEVSHD
jgi:hypothetical protein